MERNPTETRGECHTATHRGSSLLAGRQQLPPLHHCAASTQFLHLMHLHTDTDMEQLQHQQQYIIYCLFKPNRTETETANTDRFYCISPWHTFTINTINKYITSLCFCRLLWHWSPIQLKTWGAFIWKSLSVIACTGFHESRVWSEAICFVHRGIIKATAAHTPNTWLHASYGGTRVI